MRLFTLYLSEIRLEYHKCFFLAFKIPKASLQLADFPKCSVQIAVVKGFSLPTWNWVVLLIALCYCEKVLGKVSTFLQILNTVSQWCVSADYNQCKLIQLSKYDQACFCVQLLFSWSLLVRLWLQDFPRWKRLLLTVKTVLFPQNSNLIPSSFLIRQLFPSCLIVSEVSKPVVPWVWL